MRSRLHDLLCCPMCRGTLRLTVFQAGPGDVEVIEGLLECACGRTYPIVETIPRLVSNAYELFPEFAAKHPDRIPGAGQAAGPVSRVVERTRRSFGYQWTTYSKMVCDFRENFWNYLSPATPETFQGRLGLDAGCGFGRHIYHAASCGAEMVGMDFSRAIDATRANTMQLPNVHLVQADIYHPPFRPGTFDFVYSIGVLHHLPDPAAGVQSLAALVKPEGSFFVWLYSRARKGINAALEAVRAVTTRLPYPLLRIASWTGAAVDWAGFILPYRLARRMPGLGGMAERFTTARIKLYSEYPFGVSEADWFDRLAAPIRFYYDEPEVRALLAAAGLSDIRTSPTGLYGWRGCGIKRVEALAVASS